MPFKVLDVPADGRHFAVEVVDVTKGFDGNCQ